MTRIACVLLGLLCIPCLAAEGPSTPVPRDAGWVERHKGFVSDAQKQGDADLLFLGDSITDAWRNVGKDTWDKSYGQLKALNFGISGDCTQHLLWRITNGELEGIRPKVVVIMIGTNNVSHGDAAPAIARGVAAVISAVESRLPRAKILLLAVFPRAETPGDHLRAAIGQVNGMLGEFDNGSSHRYLDIGAKFLGPDGTLARDVMGDLLHPTPKGYDIWAQAMQPTLDKMLKSAGRTPTTRH